MHQPNSPPRPAAPIMGVAVSGFFLFIILKWAINHKWNFILVLGSLTGVIPVFFLRSLSQSYLAEF
jgi:hypothetical protein